MSIELEVGLTYRIFKGWRAAAFSIEEMIPRRLVGLNQESVPKNSNEPLLVHDGGNTPIVGQ